MISSSARKHRLTRPIAEIHSPQSAREARPRVICAPRTSAAPAAGRGVPDREILRTSRFRKGLKPLETELT